MFVMNDGRSETVNEVNLNQARGLWGQYDSAELLHVVNRTRRETKESRSAEHAHQRFLSVILIQISVSPSGTRP